MRLAFALYRTNLFRMPQFRYVARKSDGKLIDGVLTCNDRASAIMQVESPSAIFTAGDLIALGALEACRENGSQIPNDISLVTFDDPVFATYLSPALTAVEQPISKMAEMAVAMLYRRIRTPNDERRQVLLEPKLNVRNSVARLSHLVRVTQMIRE